MWKVTLIWRYFNVLSRRGIDGIRLRWWRWRRRSFGGNYAIENAEKTVLLYEDVSSSVVWFFVNYHMLCFYVRISIYYPIMVGIGSVIDMMMDVIYLFVTAKSVHMYKFKVNSQLQLHPSAWLQLVHFLWWIFVKKVGVWILVFYAFWEFWNLSSH